MADVCAGGQYIHQEMRRPVLQMEVMGKRSAEPAGGRAIADQKIASGSVGIPAEAIGEESGRGADQRPAIGVVAYHRTEPPPVTPVSGGSTAADRIGIAVDSSVYIQVSVTLDYGRSRLR